MSVPRLLLLETSGKGGLVALAQGETVLGELRLEAARQHTRDLTSLTERLLSQQGWRARDLDGVLVSIGPGSYTGLRVGLIAARVLAYATGCALIGVETFAAIASQVPAEVALVDVLADAQQDRLYVQSFRRVSAGLTPLAPLRIVELAEWLAARDAASSVTGPGVEPYRDRLVGVEAIEPQLPTAEGLLRIGLARYERGERDDIWGLEPIYLRPSAAEMQWLQRSEKGRDP